MKKRALNIEHYELYLAGPKGANMINIGQALEKYGICTETLMPYPNPRLHAENNRI